MSHTLRSRFNYDARKNSKNSSLHCRLKSLAVQDQLNDVDINTIVKRFGVTGKIPVLPVPPEFGNYEYSGSFHDAMNLVALTNETFDAQPSHIREKFGNDPQKMLDYLNNPDYTDDSIKLGLRTVRVEEVPIDQTSAPPLGGTKDEGKA